MAENIVLDFTSDTKPIDSAINKLEQLGKVDKANADQFRKNNDEYVNAAIKRKQLIEVEQRALEQTRDRLKKAFSVEDINAFNASIKNSEANIRSLKGEVDKTGTGMGNFVNTLKNVAGAIGIAFGVQQIVQFGKEAVELAAKGEGIRRAFAKIGDDAALEKLRVATRGATSDIDLMAAALRASNFNISTDLLAKGLELAGKVSRQTGQDVTYLTNSFVDGLGRKSIRILDNLQISQVALQAEIKKTGDFNTAVGNIVNAKLKEMGDVAETTADKFAKITTASANLKEAIGQALIQQVTDFSDALKGLFGGQEERAKLVANATTDLSEKLAKGFIESGKAGDKLLSLNKQISDQQQLVSSGFADDQEKEQKSLNALIILRHTLLRVLKETNDAEAKKKQSNIAPIDEDAIKKALEAKEKLDEKIFQDEKKLRQMILDLQAHTEEEKLRREADLQIQSIHEITANEILKAEAVTQVEVELNNKLADLNQKRLDKKEEQDKKAAEKAKSERLKEQQADSEEKARALDDELKLLEDQETAKEKARLDIAEEGINALEELNQRALDSKLGFLQEELNAGQITQEQFDEQSKVLKRKAANRDKLLAAFNIALKTSEGVLNYLSNTVTAPLVPFVIASGAIQEGLVLSRPIPFAKGTKAVKGGTPGKDSVHALVMPDEMIIPVDRKKKYEPILNAIFDEKISPDLLNSLALKGKMSFGQSKGIDEYDISNAMDRSLRKGLVIKNFPKQENMSADEIKLQIRRGIW